MLLKIDYYNNLEKKICSLQKGKFLSFIAFYFAVTALIFISSTPLLADDKLLERGQQLFKKCVHCHTYNKHHGHRIGPNLYGMFGRKAGAILDYDFSDAWKKADFIWTDQTLDTYLKAPHKMIPNNRMPFNGLSKPDDRRALITYMRTIVVP